MQREQFLDLESEPWWLLERELDPALEERRRSLGQCWGWTDVRWYADPRKLEELYLFLEQTVPDLLRDLDDAVDVDRRKKWLDELIEKKQPAVGAETQEAAAPEPPAPAAAAKVGAVGARRPGRFPPSVTPSRPSRLDPRSARRKPPRGWRSWRRWRPSWLGWSTTSTSQKPRN